MLVRAPFTGSGENPNEEKEQILTVTRFLNLQITEDIDIWSAAREESQ
jgi:hypothetical protein